ncbi:MAG: hypothetical protein GY793_07195, partial [Proteobacteria bacterium]|nr:hypothetical protein [Pseudomonadota bacterium]
MKKLLITIFPVLIISVMFFGGLMQFHNVKMNIYESSVKKSINSNDYRVVETEQYFGILWGNGNKCNAVIFILIETCKNSGEVYNSFHKILNATRP